MVRTPSFKIEVNGADKTLELLPYFVGLEFSDDVDDEADGFNIKFAGVGFNAPSFKDKFKVWIGYKETGLFFIGSFTVLKVRLDFEAMETDITATPVDFGSKIKEKRTTTYEKTNIKGILTRIGGRHKLKVKCDIPNDTVKHKNQTDKSDLEFLQELATARGVSFAIKNDTIIFTPKGAKKKGLPLFVVDSKETKGLSFEMVNKTVYGSCVATWKDTKTNKDLSVSIGASKPVLQIKSTYKDKDEAKMKALSSLEEANRGLVTGSFNFEGMNIIAGGRLRIEGLPSGWNSEFMIKRVRHSLNDGGYDVSVEFEN